MQATVIPKHRRYMNALQLVTIGNVGLPSIHDGISGFKAEIDPAKLEEIAANVDLIATPEQIKLSNGFSEYHFKDRGYVYMHSPEEAPPKTSRESDAFYEAAVIRDDSSGVLLLQVIPHGGSTSHHYHELDAQQSLSLLGESDIEIHAIHNGNKTEMPLSDRQFTFIPQNIAHQLKAKNDIAVNAVFVKNFNPTDTHYL